MEKVPVMQAMKCCGLAMVFSIATDVAIAAYPNAATPKNKNKSDGNSGNTAGGVG